MQQQMLQAQETALRLGKAVGEERAQRAAQAKQEQDRAFSLQHQLGQAEGEVQRLEKRSQEDRARLKAQAVTVSRLLVSVVWLGPAAHSRLPRGHDCWSPTDTVYPHPLALFMNHMQRLFSAYLPDTSGATATFVWALSQWPRGGCNTGVH